MLSVFETEDLTAPEVLTDPYGYFGHLRETDPVHWNPLHGEWIVTRHSDVTWLVRQHELFSSAVTGLEDPSSVFPPVDEEDWGLVEYLNSTSRPFMLHDRPEHLAMRQVLHKWFTPRAVEKSRLELRDKARELIDGQLATGSMEVKEDFAVWLPLTTISRMLDVPVEDAVQLRETIETFIHSPFSSDRMRPTVQAWRELQAYFSPLIDARADAPGEDLISLLADGERRGAFTRQQALASAVHVMVAGHETTLNLITNGVHAFIRNPDQWQILQKNPEALCKGAVEECLRYEPSVKGLTRIATTDLELGGKEVKAGDRLFWVMSSANRDPNVFSDPDKFDIMRSPNPHTGFGGGIHHCLGAALARIEAQESFRALAERLPRISLVDEAVEYETSKVDRAPKALRISWS